MSCYMFGMMSLPLADFDRHAADPSVVSPSDDSSAPVIAVGDDEIDVYGDLDASPVPEPPRHQKFDEARAGSQSDLRRPVSYFPLAMR